MELAGTNWQGGESQERKRIWKGPQFKGVRSTALEDSMD